MERAYLRSATVPRLGLKPLATLWVSSNVADTLDRKPYASRTGHIFEDPRSEDEINQATHDLIQNAKPVIQRDSQGEIIGQLLWILFISDTLMRYVSTGIDQDLLNSITDRERPSPIQHGPHIVVASETTSELFLIYDVLKCHAYIRSN
jgi:hypothetical protein